MGTELQEGTVETQDISSTRQLGYGASRQDEGDQLRESMVSASLVSHHGAVGVHRGAVVSHHGVEAGQHGIEAGHNGIEALHHGVEAGLHEVEAGLHGVAAGLGGAVSGHPEAMGGHGAVYGHRGAGAGHRGAGAGHDGTVDSHDVALCDHGGAVGAHDRPVGGLVRKVVRLAGYETVAVEDKIKYSSKVEREIAKVEKITTQLTKDPSTNLDHRTSLLETATTLNNLRFENNSSDVNLEEMKQQVMDCTTTEALLNLLWSHPGVREFFAKRENSSNLEDLLTLPVTGNPLCDFPPDINSNVYSKIVSFGLEHSRGIILLFLKLLVKNDKPVLEKDVIRISFLSSGTWCFQKQQCSL